MSTKHCSVYWIQGNHYTLENLHILFTNSGKFYTHEGWSMQIETNLRVSTILKLAHRCPLPVMLPFLTFSVQTIFYFFWEPYFFHKFIRFQPPAETAYQPRRSKSRTILRGIPTHQIIAATTRPKSIDTDKSHLEGIVTTIQIDIPDSRIYHKKGKTKKNSTMVQFKSLQVRVRPQSLWDSLTHSQSRTVVKETIECVRATPSVSSKHARLQTFFLMNSFVITAILVILKDCIYSLK